MERAFEALGSLVDLLNHLGWIEAPAILPSLDGESRRGALLGAGEFDELVACLLGDEPQSIVDALLTALRRGTAPAELGQAVAQASSLRIARFPTSNEFGDWDTVHNTESLGRAVLREDASTTTRSWRAPPCASMGRSRPRVRQRPAARWSPWRALRRRTARPRGRYVRRTRLRCVFSAARSCFEPPSDAGPVLERAAGH